MPARRPLSLGDHAVLALITEQPRHGWALVRELAPNGDVGRVWALSRPLTYRAIDNLEALQLIRAKGTESGDGPRRTIYTATAAGERELAKWFASPVEHLRNVRTEFLLKLVLATRAGMELRPMIRIQQRAVRPIISGLEEAAAAPDADFVDLWRYESAQAVERFLDGAAR